MAGSAEAAVEAGIYRLKRRLERLGHNNALASRKAISLHNQRGAELFTVGARSGGIGKALVASRGDAICIHKTLGIGFGAFKLSALGIGAEYGDACLAKHIGNARHKRSLGADYHQLDAMLLREGEHSLGILGIKILHIVGDACRTAVAWGNVELGAARRLRQRPRNSMLAAAAAKNQDVHGSNLSSLMPKSTPAACSAKVLCN